MVTSSTLYASDGLLDDFFGLATEAELPVALASFSLTNLNTLGQEDGQAEVALDPTLSFQLVFFSRSAHAAARNEWHDLSQQLHPALDEDKSSGGAAQELLPATLWLQMDYSLTEGHLRLDPQTRRFKSQAPQQYSLSLD